MNHNLPIPNFLPPHAIWFQTMGKFKAAVSVVNNQYRYEIFNSITGKRVLDGSKISLPFAKSMVFKYFKEQE